MFHCIHPSVARLSRPDPIHRDGVECPSLGLRAPRVVRAIMIIAVEHSYAHSFNSLAYSKAQSPCSLLVLILSQGISVLISNFRADCSTALMPRVALKSD